MSFVLFQSMKTKLFSIVLGQVKLLIRTAFQNCLSKQLGLNYFNLVHSCNSFQPIATDFCYLGNISAFSFIINFSDCFLANILWQILLTHFYLYLNFQHFLEHSANFTRVLKSEVNNL